MDGVLYKPEECIMHKEQLSAGFLQVRQAATQPTGILLVIPTCYGVGRNLEAMSNTAFHSFYTGMTNS